MSRRLGATTRLLLAGLLLGSFGLAAPAAGQQQEPGLEVDWKDSRTTPGQLKVTVAMSGPAWGSGQELAAGDFTATLDNRPATVTRVTPLQGGQGTGTPVAVILAVDTSGSMLDFNNIDKARAAARNFAGQMKSGTQLGVVSFANQPAVEQDLTTNPSLVRSAIDGLAVDDPKGNTALYDAVVVASKALARQPGQRNLVVLSDGRHEGTSTSIEQAIGEARKAKVNVYTVGLEVPGREQDQEALRRLATATGGKALPVSAENLEALLGDIGRELASQYVVDIEVPPGLPSEVDLRLEARANNAEGRLEKRLLLGGLASPSTVAGPAELLPAPGLSPLESEQGRLLAIVTGFATVLLAGLLLLGPRSRGGRPYRMLRQRISPYSLTPAIADEQPRLTAFGSSEWAGRATAMAETLVRRGNLEEAFLDRLEAAGLNMRVAEFVLISLGSAFVPPLLVAVATRNFLLTAVVVVLGVVGPFLYLAVRASRRQAKFEEQLPSTLQLLAGAMQAGHSLQQAVDTVVHEAGDPIAAEFQRVLTEARLGRPVEEAFEAMAKRTRSVDFEWTVMAIKLQRQVGGNLAEVLATVSTTIRERYSLKRQIRALSAEGRLSSLILSVLPILIFLALLLLNPSFLAPLYSTPVGLVMMAGAAVLMIIGVLWLRKLTQIKV